MTAMINKAILFLGAAGAAVGAYILAHDVLHYARLEIGRDAVIMAGVIAVGCTAASLIEKK
jgi:hypothetical protein